MNRQCHILGLKSTHHMRYEASLVDLKEKVIHDFMSEQYISTEYHVSRTIWCSGAKTDSEKHWGVHRNDEGRDSFHFPLLGSIEKA